MNVDNLDELKIQYLNQQACFLARFVTIVAEMSLAMLVTMLMLSFFIDDFVVPLRWLQELKTEDTLIQHLSHAFYYCIMVQVLLTYLSVVVIKLTKKINIKSSKIYHFTYPYVIVMCIVIVMNLAFFMHLCTTLAPH